jgi:hypothetical protein
MRITNRQLRRIIMEELEMVSVEERAGREEWADGEVIGYMSRQIESAVKGLMKSSGSISKAIDDNLKLAKRMVQGGDDVEIGDIYMPLYRIVSRYAGDDEVGRMITLLLLYGPNLDPTADYAKRHRAVRNP